MDSKKHCTLKRSLRSKKKTVVFGTKIHNDSKNIINECIIRIKKYDKSDAISPNPSFCKIKNDCPTQEDEKYSEGIKDEPISDFEDFLDEEIETLLNEDVTDSQLKDFCHFEELSKKKKHVDDKTLLEECTDKKHLKQSDATDEDEDFDSDDFTDFEETLAFNGLLNNEKSDTEQQNFDSSTSKKQKKR